MQSTGCRYDELTRTHQAESTASRTADGGTPVQFAARLVVLIAVFCSGDPNGPSQPQEGQRPADGGKTQEQWQGVYQCVYAMR